MSSHECEASRNPRHAGYCDCGQALPAPAPSTLRDVPWERQATREAGRGFPNVVRLIHNAEHRATVLSGEYVTDPMMVAAGKDWRQHCREELEDARNYVLWLIAEDPEDAAALNALRLIVQAHYFLG